MSILQCIEGYEYEFYPDNDDWIHNEGDYDKIFLSFCIGNNIPTLISIVQPGTIYYSYLSNKLK